MGIIDTLKDAVTLVQKTDNIDLIKQMLSIQSQAMDMQEENRSLREQVKALQSKLTFAGTLRFEAPLYFAADDKTPFCARCWESDQRAMHLAGDWNGRRWECHKCKTVYLLDGTARPGVVF